MKLENTIKKIAQMIHKGNISPWKAEQAALEEGVSVPEHIAVAAKARRMFIEEKSGQPFCHIMLPENPYQIAYRCPNDGTQWSLAADDSYVNCGICGTSLEMLDEEKRFSAFVNNYIGGVEDYYSYAGEVSVGGDVNKTFQNILCWGPGKRNCPKSFPKLPRVILQIGTVRCLMLIFCINNIMGIVSYIAVFIPDFPIIEVMAKRPIVQGWLKT
jgi:hypothetical protein